MPAERSSSSSPRFMQRWLLALSFVVVLVLGYIGAWDFLEAQAARVPDREPPTVWDNLYLTLKLFLVEADLETGPKNVPLELARFLAPLLTVITAALAFVSVFRQWFRMLWCKNHVLVCGLGEKGFHLVKDLCENNRQVVVLELDEENDRSDLARASGALVIHGDATDQATLRKVKAWKARHVIAFTGEDLDNLLIAERTGRLKRDLAANDDRTTCLVHVSDLELWERFKRRDWFDHLNAALDCRAFNMQETSARRLVREHPLEPMGFDAADSRGIHLVVIGFGRMGQAVALQALKYGHYANRKQVWVTAVDRSMAERERAFRTLYRSFDKVGRMDFLCSEAEDAELQENLRKWAQDDQQVLNMAVCLGNDTSSLNCALWLVDLFEEGSLPIRVNLEQDPSVVTTSESHVPPIQVFGRLTEMCTEDAVINALQDDLARAIHEDYFKAMLGHGEERGCRPSMYPWNELNEELRDSNRQQADHGLTKLRSLGLYAATEPRNPNDEEIVDFEETFAAELEALARAEHNRWCASRYLGDWQWGKERNDAKKIHNCLVPWDELEEKDRNKDRAAVKSIGKHLKSVGFRVFRSSVT